MTRQNIYGNGTNQTRVVGHFNRDKATEYPEGTRFDGNNHISLATGTQWEHEALFRTAGGRWVLNWWSQWQGTVPTWQYVEPEWAREWLLRNEYDDDAVEAALGVVVAEEESPGEYGRPLVGPKIEVRLDAFTLTVLDALAAADGKKRAEYVRGIITQHVKEQQA